MNKAHSAVYQLATRPMVVAPLPEGEYSISTATPQWYIRVATALISAAVLLEVSFTGMWVQS